MGNKRRRDDPPIGGGGESSDDPQEEQSADQTAMDDFDESDADSGSDDQTSQTSIPSSDGSSGGGGAGAVPVTPVPEPPEPADPDQDPSEEQKQEPSEDTGEPEPEPEAPDEPDAPDEEPDAEDNHDAEEETDDEEDEDEEEQEVTIVQYMDPWSNMAWGVEPIMKRIQEAYGDNVDLSYELVPVREFDDPDTMTTKWKQDADLHGMPVDTSVWEADPPESTALANRAYATAQEQGDEIARDYLRRLRIAALVEGTNIEDREVLVDLAEEVGLDTDQFAADWETVDIGTDGDVPELPETVTTIDGFTFDWHGYLDFKDFETYFLQIGLHQQPPRSLPAFVTANGPVTTREIMEVYDWSHDEAIQELQHLDATVPVRIGNATFWVRPQHAPMEG